MRTSTIKNVSRIFCLMLFVLLTSCMVQLSSVPKLTDTNISESNKALLGISAEYTMNMASSKDVKFYLEEISTGKVIAPEYRDNTNNNYYFNVDPGTYRIILITIKEQAVSKSIIFNHSTKTIVKSLLLADPNQISINNSAISFSRTVFLGDKNLVYSDTISNLVKIEPNTAYYLGEYQFEGYIENIFNDMPNIRIKKIEPPLLEKLESFKRIVDDSYQNSSNGIITTESLFNTDFIDLAKSNALK